VNSPVNFWGAVLRLGAGTLAYAGASVRTARRHPRAAVGQIGSLGPNGQQHYGGNVGAVSLLGVRLVPWTEEQTVEHVIGRLSSREPDRGGWIVTANVDILRQLVTDCSARCAVDGATVGVADGMPLVWAGKLQATPLPERVTGASLLDSLSCAACKAGCSIYLLGGEAGVAERAGGQLADRYPGLRVTGWSPPVGLETMAKGLDQIRARLRAAEPGIVFCAFGFPKQERLIGKLIADFPNVWFLGCGGSFNFAAGRIDRAPIWMQRAGLEWLHRLIREPRRMFRRYVVNDIPFALRLLSASTVARLRLRAAPSDEHVLVDLTRYRDDARAPIPLPMTA
jgi:N-acetylglucosaminyldiphosphoundecaprenol N-acetyl-beta-D-mannosaminyltransferase